MNRQIGVVTHYYDRAKVAVVRLTSTLHLGDVVKIVRGRRELAQAVVEIQLDRADIPEASEGQEVGIKVSDPVKRGSRVVKLA